MRSRLLVVALLVLGAVCRGATADEASKNYHAYGVGFLSCGDYLDARRTPHGLIALSLENWLGGYLTAMSYVASGSNKNPSTCSPTRT